MRPQSRAVGRKVLQLALGASILASTACQNPENTGTAAKAPAAADAAKTVALSAEAGAAAKDSGIKAQRRVMHTVSRTVFSSSVKGIYGGAGSGMTFDANNNLYVAQNVGFGAPYHDQPQGAKVSKITPSGEVSDVIPQGSLVGATDVAVDAAGNLFVAEGIGYLAPFWGNPQGNRVLKRTPSGQISTFITKVNNPTGLTFDRAGNLYVASWNDNAIYKYSPSGEPLGKFAGGFDAQPYDIATDANDNIYVAAALGYVNNKLFSGKRIYKVTPDGASSVFYTAPFGGEPVGLAFDAEGHLWASYYNSLKIVRVAPNGSAVVHSAYDAGQPADTANGIAIDSQGNLYGQMNSRTIVKWTGLAPAPPQPKDCSEEVAAAQAQLDAALAQVSGLQASNGALSAQVTELQSANSALSAQVADLQSANSALSSQVADLQAANAALSAQVADLQAANAALSAQVADLQAANTALSGQLAAEKAARAAVQAQLDTVNATVAGFVSSLQGDFRTTFRDTSFTIPGA
ncbi:MAG: hypothetical protein FJZ00_07400, partial [Candidatus Sericytochromatia bacterium]|nr:hypothetical protein [Candidatus Tanganyikabacteria bacterium]